jgi:O-acetyl-ADP-ribose deacetylase (regulator of RNase III)
MIESKTGDLLKADTEALVNTVNCVGVMGKGIALQFKQAFPENFKEYAKACKTDDVRIGKMFIHKTKNMFNPKYIINFPTKRDWRAKSQLKDIEMGLDDLIIKIKELDIKSIAIPPLGAGLGGLNWEDVKFNILNSFKELPEVRVLLYEPKGSPDSDKIKISTTKPEMTRGRALLIKLLESYRSLGYRLSLLEIQKLMYFMQQTGEDLRLKFVKHKYGPYAENLNHVLQRIDGHYIRGYGDRKSKAEIFILNGAVQEADNFLEIDNDAQNKLAKVKRLINGFETPYGLELLSTVHWTVLETPECKEKLDLLISKIQSWSSRKEMILKPRHIEKAFNRLDSEKWL